MASFTRTWWGDRFIAALESFTDAGRLGRGRSYARGGKVLNFDIQGNQITARVKGSVNPYFGVYKEPTYHISIEMDSIPRAKWTKAIQALASKASMVSKLMLNEVPNDIETVFDQLNLSLLPKSRKDFTTSCSCPDYSNPCKHIAGVYYLVAAQLDQDPFLLFELRGLSRADLQVELKQSPLGQALSSELEAKPIVPEPATALYTRPQPHPVAQPPLKEFWQGKRRLPQSIEPATSSGVSAILIKKQGDFPAFWHKDGSFIETMEELYQRVKRKNNDL
ncbi:SWIM zinc finger family protein [Phormidium tenue FACHB-886]|nr:SWIM zinc finger family protein [Phormidium tenue FACHB-886]